MFMSFLLQMMLSVLPLFGVAKPAETPSSAALKPPSFESLFGASSICAGVTCDLNHFCCQGLCIAMRDDCRINN